MRDIKFRGLTKHGTWLYGDLVQYRNETKAIIGKQLSASGYLSVEGARITLVRGETVGQFTGCKDSKGADIYEGDIVYIAGFGVSAAEIHREDGVVFNDYNCNYRQFIDAHVENDIGHIVGNIHQNPELLKGDNNG